MKRLISVIALFIVISCISSCGIIKNSITNNINREVTKLDVEIFQTLSSTSALAHTSDHKIVKIVTNKDVYYDGKNVNGWFRLIDTYTYESRDERIRTVPVFQKTSELKQ